MHVTLVYINAAFIFNYYKFNTSSTKSTTFKACFKRYGLQNKSSNHYIIQIVMNTSELRRT